jgi:putative component of toxin-antitoxin plasmid stabilization module
VKSPEEWQIDVSYASRARFKKFNRNHPLEYSSCFANLDKVLSLLNSGHSLGAFQLGFLRPEGEGLSRIGQTGVSAARESRLYVYFVQQGRTVYILGIGTKETQQADIAAAKKLIKKIKKSG